MCDPKTGKSDSFTEYNDNLNETCSAIIQTLLMAPVNATTNTLECFKGKDDGASNKRNTEIADQAQIAINKMGTDFKHGQWKLGYKEYSVEGRTANPMDDFWTELYTRFSKIQNHYSLNFCTAGWAEKYNSVPHYTDSNVYTWYEISHGGYDLKWNPNTATWTSNKDLMKLVELAGCREAGGATLSWEKIEKIAAANTTPKPPA